VTASSYSVNILLDATKAKSELSSLEKRVNTFRQKMMKAISLEDRGARKREKAIRDTDKRRTADIRDAYFKKRVRDLELKGVKGLEEANKQLDKTQEDINKKAYGALRTRLKIVKDEINAAVRLNNEKAKGVALDKKVRPFPVIQNPNLYGPQQGGYTYGAGQAPVSIDARYNQQVRRAGFDHRINMLSAQGVDQAPFRKQMGRITQAQAGKKGTNLGTLKQEDRIMEKLLKKAERKLGLSRKELQVNKAIVRDKAQMVKAEGDFSMLSDRKSYDVKGRRTFANNAIGRALGGRGFDRAAGMQGALISGAFPLLFGQGPAVAAAGAVGGGLGGGLFGQGGSFAGGIAATAAVTAISGAVNAVKELGQAMGPFTQDTDALIAATGQANTFREKELKLIEKLQGKQAAFNEAMKDMTKLVGEKGVKALKQFGEDTKRLSEDWSRFMTKMSAGLARLVNWSGILKQGRKATITKARGADYADDEDMQGLLGRVDALSGRRRTGSVNAELLKLEKDIKERILYLDEQNVITQDKKLAKMEAQAEHLKNLNSLYKDIGGTIKDGIVQGIQAAIDGTKTLGEIAGNVFRKISNALLDFGVSLALSKLPIPGADKFFGFKAAGGPVKSGGSYVVGEKGPELFTPSSSGHITPNHEMGGTNVVVNVDASGSSVEGDAGQAEQLGSMLAAAVQAELVNQQRPGGLLAGTR